MCLCLSVIVCSRYEAWVGYLVFVLLYLLVYLYMSVAVDLSFVMVMVVVVVVSNSIFLSGMGCVLCLAVIGTLTHLSVRGLESFFRFYCSNSQVYILVMHLRMQVCAYVETMARRGRGR